MISDLRFLDIHPYGIYDSDFDPTTPYYEDPNNKITPDQYDEMKQLDREPLNEEEIKLVRQILPSHIPATKLNLISYVSNRRSKLSNKRYNTYREQDRLGDEFLRLRNNGYTPLEETLSEKLREIISIKAEIEFYFLYNQELRYILRDVNEKIKELKI